MEPAQVIFLSVDELLTKLDDDSKYILYNPDLGTSTSAEIRAFVLLSQEIEKKGVKSIFWIEERYMNKENLCQLLSSDKIPNCDALWLISDSLNEDLRSKISFIFTSQEYKCRENFKNIRLASFRHYSGIVYKGDTRTYSEFVDKYNSGKLEEVFEGKFGDIHPCMLAPAYFFVSSSTGLLTNYLTMKRIAGLKPSYLGNMRGYLDVGYLRVEAYNAARNSKPEKTVILLMPVYINCGSQLDYYSNLEALSLNFPDCEIWFRPAPNDSRLGRMNDVFEKCKKLSNVYINDFILYGDLVDIYKKVTVLISDYSSSMTTFLITTGRPCIQIMTPKVQQEIIGCFNVHSISELVDMTKIAITDPEIVGQQQQAELLQYFSPNGDLIEYISANFNKMLRGEALPNSFSYNLGMEGRFNSFDDYFEFIKINFRCQESSGNSSSNPISYYGPQVSNLLDIIELMLQRQNLVLPDNMDLSQCVMEIFKYFIDNVINKIEQNKVSPFFIIRRFIEIYESSYPSNIVEDDRMQRTDNLLKYIFSTINIMEFDIQLDFYNYCRKLINYIQIIKYVILGFINICKVAWLIGCPQTIPLRFVIRFIQYGRYLGWVIKRVCLGNILFCFR